MPTTTTASNPNTPRTIIDYRLVMPTPLNILSEIHKNIVGNLRRGRSGDLALPSLYRLAYAIHYNTGEMLITNVDEE